jgi:hypothetical protein
VDGLQAHGGLSSKGQGIDAPGGLKSSARTLTLSRLTWRRDEPAVELEPVNAAGNRTASCVSPYRLGAQQLAVRVTDTMRFARMPVFWFTALTRSAVVSGTGC